MITVNINNKTRRGKHLVELLRELAKSGDDINIVQEPNIETINSVKNARKGKGFSASNIEELFDQLNS